MGESKDAIAARNHQTLVRELHEFVTLDWTCGRVRSGTVEVSAL